MAIQFNVSFAASKNSSTWQILWVLQQSELGLVCLLEKLKVIGIIPQQNDDQSSFFSILLENETVMIFICTESYNMLCGWKEKDWPKLCLMQRKNESWKNASDVRKKRYWICLWFVFHVDSVYVLSVNFQDVLLNVHYMKAINLIIIPYSSAKYIQHITCCNKQTYYSLDYSCYCSSADEHSFFYGV